VFSFFLFPPSRAALSCRLRVLSDPFPAGRAVGALLSELQWGWGWKVPGASCRRPRYRDIAAAKAVRAEHHIFFLVQKARLPCSSNGNFWGKLYLDLNFNIPWSAFSPEHDLAVAAQCAARVSRGSGGIAATGHHLSSSEGQQVQPETATPVYHTRGLEWLESRDDCNVEEWFTKQVKEHALDF